MTGRRSRLLGAGFKPDSVERMVEDIGRLPSGLLRWEGSKEIPPLYVARTSGSDNIERVIFYRCSRAGVSKLTPPAP